MPNTKKVPRPAAEALGAYLSRRRALLGWTQDSLARMTGLSRQTIDRYERGIGRLLPAPWLKLCEALGLCREAASLYEAARAEQVEIFDSRYAERLERQASGAARDWGEVVCDIPKRKPTEEIRPRMFCCHCPEMLAEPPVPEPQSRDDVPELPECCQEPCTPEREAHYQAWLARQKPQPVTKPSEMAWLLDEAIEEAKVIA